MLAGVNGAMNAVFAVGDAVGETMFYGAGAGSLPTASAVMADILSLAAPLAHGLEIAAEAAPYEHVLPMVPADELESRFYVRIELAQNANETAEAVNELRSSLIELGVPVHPEVATKGADVTFTTDSVAEKVISAALAKIEGHADVAHIASVIRIEDTAAWTQA